MSWIEEKGEEILERSEGRSEGVEEKERRKNLQRLKVISKKAVGDNSYDYNLPGVHW